LAGDGALGYFHVLASSTLTSSGGFTNASARQFLVNGGSTLSLGGNLNMGSASVELFGDASLNVTNGTLTLTNGIASGDTVTKTGAGTLILGGANNTTGTALNGGTILSLGANSLGANLTLSSGLLDLNGNNGTFSTIAFNGSAFTVTNGSVMATNGYTASNTTVAMNLTGSGLYFTSTGGRCC